MQTRINRSADLVSISGCSAAQTVNQAPGTSLGRSTTMPLNLLLKARRIAYTNRVRRQLRDKHGIDMASMPKEVHGPFVGTCKHLFVAGISAEDVAKLLATGWRRQP
jgi:hypothetical protein